MKTVYKYEVQLADNFEIIMPVEAELLTVQLQRGIPQLWALVPTDGHLKTAKRAFRLAGTGHQIDDTDLLHKYIGSFQMQQENLIFHLFELQELPF